MDKLIYLKKFNESTNNDELDFKTFKELLFDLSDYYDCEFKENPGTKYRQTYYLCEVSIPNSITIRDNKTIQEVLNIFTNGECDFEENDQRINNVLSVFDKKINDLNKVKDIITILKDIVTRFEEFSNVDKGFIYYNSEYKLHFYIDLK